MRRLKRGDETAWAEVFPKLWPVARRAAATPMAGLRSPELDDVAIETLSHIATRTSSIDSLIHLRAFTATVAFRKAISLARHKSATKRTAPNPDTGEEQTPERASAIERLDGIQLRELLTLLVAALAQLDGETRSILWDKHVTGLSYQELAVKYRKPVGTVAARVARGLVKVRNSLRQSPGLLNELTAFLR